MPLFTDFAWHHILLRPSHQLGFQAICVRTFNLSLSSLLLACYSINFQAAWIYSHTLSYSFRLWPSVLDLTLNWASYSKRVKVNKTKPLISIFRQDKVSQMDSYHCGLGNLPLHFRGDSNALSRYIPWQLRTQIQWSISMANVSIRSSIRLNHWLSLHLLFRNAI